MLFYIIYYIILCYFILYYSILKWLREQLRLCVVVPTQAAARGRSDGGQPEEDHMNRGSSRPSVASLGPAPRSRPSVPPLGRVPRSVPRSRPSVRSPRSGCLLGGLRLQTSAAAPEHQPGGRLYRGGDRRADPGPGGLGTGDRDTVSAGGEATWGQMLWSCCPTTALRLPVCLLRGPPPGRCSRPGGLVVVKMAGPWE